MESMIILINAVFKMYLLYNMHNGNNILEVVREIFALTKRDQARSTAEYTLAKLDGYPGMHGELIIIPIDVGIRGGQP